MRNKFFFVVACMLLSFQFLSAQEITVRGKVTSGDVPLSNVSIQVKGALNTTQTGANGEYSISAPPNGTLVFTSVGFTQQEVKVNKQTSLDINLKSTSQELAEVVVVGYGTQKRKDLTGAVSSIGEAQIQKVPVTTIDQAIQGRAAGVNVINNDGSPGGSVQIQIRGIGSLGNNDPLIVVDGYPISGGLNTINPNDIASVDILKDASATAIYGNRAANGVVIINTKRGKRNGVQLDLDALTSVQAEPKQYKLLTAVQWATLANKLAPIDGFSTLPEWSNPSSLRNIDWQQEIYQKGLKQNYNIALRGGNEKIQTAFSAGYFDQKGIVLGSKFQRINLSLNLDYNAFTWLKSSSSFKFTRGDNKIPFGTGSIGGLNTLPPSITGNNITDQAKDANGNYGFYNPVNPNTKLYTNPLYSIETTDQKNLTNYFLGTTSLEVTIWDGLKIKSNIGINTNDYSGYFFRPSDKRAQEQYGLGAINALSLYSQSSNSTFEWLWENTLSYTKTFGDHSIDFVGGVSAQENTFRQMGIQGEGSVSDELRNAASIQTITNQYGNQQTYSLASQFGRINYKFMDKYLVTGTVRRDGSSKFAPDHQYGVFPSGSVAWKVKEESFLKNNDIITDLKIRASYGEVGNQNSVGLFQYLSSYSPGGPSTSIGNVGYPFNKIYQPGLILSSLPNPDLKWETTKLKDFGLDLALLKGALTLTVDYYSKESKDFLLNIPVPAQTGFTTAARNVGSIRNSGIEVVVDYRKTKKDFSYGINLNFSTINNELLSLTAGQTALTNFQLNENGLFQIGGSSNWGEFSQSKIGGAVGEFFGYKAAGIFQTQKEIDDLNSVAETKHGSGSVYQGTTVAGDRKFVDVNGDGWVTPDDRVSLGSPIPKLFGSFNLDASYKSFDFSAFFYGVSGNKIFNNNQSNLESFGGLSNISADYLSNSWTPTNPSNKYPRVTTTDYNQNRSGRPSDAFIEDGSYLRLRSVQLGYTFPSSLTSKASISRARLFISAQNLFTITNYSGLDPEIGLPVQGNGARNVYASGVDIGTYPTSKFYTVGFNVTF
ncbi:MAG: TonB-dependent receptor [Ferruginibacter sp.]